MDLNARCIWTMRCDAQATVFRRPPTQVCVHWPLEKNRSLEFSAVFLLLYSTFRLNYRCVVASHSHDVDKENMRKKQTTRFLFVILSNFMSYEIEVNGMILRHFVFDFEGTHVLTPLAKKKNYAAKIKSYSRFVIVSSNSISFAWHAFNET